MEVVKRHGETEAYDERKVYASVYAAALNCHHKEHFCENMAELSEQVLTLSRADIYFARFDDDLLPPVGMKECAVPPTHPDFPHTPKMPDLVSIFMPDIDDREMQHVRLEAN